jgi:hypothetical protein
MVRLRCASTVLILSVGLAVEAEAQTEKTLPTDSEINLLLTQTERAIQQYRPLIDQEEVQLGESVADTLAHDRQVVSGLETAVKAFKAKPQGFNGPLGFAFFEWLDDASRNAALCAGGSANQAMRQLLAGNTDRSDFLLHLGRACADMSTLIYTISENAGSLYQRYVETEQGLAEQAANVAEECRDILKKNGVGPAKK